MKPQLSELVDAILQRLAERAGRPETESGMRNWLMRQGYKKGDIEAALAMLHSRLAPAVQGQGARHTSFRHLSGYELQKLSQPAREALTRLEAYELIDPYERELILDRLGQFEGEVSMDDLDYLITWILGATRDVESLQTIFDVMDGDEMTLH